MEKVHMNLMIKQLPMVEHIVMTMELDMFDFKELVVVLQTHRRDVTILELVPATQLHATHGLDQVTQKKINTL